MPGDRSAASPGGVRIGAPALTTRGFKEAEFVEIAGFLDRILQLTLKIQVSSLPYAMPPCCVWETRRHLSSS